MVTSLRIPLDQSYANTDRFKNEGGDLDGEYQQDRYTVNTSAYGDASFDPYALYSRDWDQDPVGLDDSGVDQQGPYTHDEVLQQQHGDESQQPYLPDHEGANDLNNSLQDSYASDQAGYRDSDGRGGVQLDQFSAEQLDYDIDNGVPGVLQNPNFSRQPDLYGGTVHQHPHDAAQPDLPVYDSGSPNLPLSFDPLGGNNSDQEPYVANNGGHTILNQPDDQQSGRDDQSYPHAPDQPQSEDNANPSPFRLSHFPDGNVHGTPYSTEQPVYDGVDSFSNNLRHDDDGGETGSLQQDVPTNQYIDFHGLDTSKGSGQNVQFPQAHNLSPDDSFLGESDSAQEAFPAVYGPGEPDQYEDFGQDSWDSIGPEPGPDPVQDGSEASQDGWNSPQLQEPVQGYHGGQYGRDQRGNGDTRNQGNNGSGGSALRPPLYSANQYEHGHQSSDQGDNLSATPAIENVIDELQQDLASSTSQGSLAQPSHHPQTGYAQQQPHQQLSPHGQQQHPLGSTPPNHVQYSPRPPVHHPQQPPRPPTDYQQQLPRPPAHHPQQSPRPPANQQPPRPPANHPQQPPRPPTNHPQQPPGPPANYQSSQPTTSHHQQPLRPSASNNPRPSAMQPTKHPAGNHHTSTPGSSLTQTKPFQYNDNSGTPQVAQPQRPQGPAFSSQQVSTHGSSPRPTGPAQTPATQSLPQGLQQQLARPTPTQRPTIHTPGNTSQRPASGGGDVAHSQNSDQVSPPTHPAQPPARVPTSQLPGPGHSPDMQHQRSQSGHLSNLPQRLGSPGMPLSGQRRHSSQTPPGHSAEQSMRPSMLHHSGPGSSGRPPNELHRPQVTRPTQPPGAAAPHHAQPPPIPSATTTHQPVVSGESFLLAEVTSAAHVSGQTSVPHELPSPASAPRAQTNPQSGTNHRLHRPSAQHSSSEGSRRPPYTPQQLPPNASAAHHSSPPLAPATHPFQHPVEPLRPIRPARHPSNIAQPQNHPQPPATHQPSNRPSQQTPPTPPNPPSNNTLLQSRPPQSFAHQSLDSSPQWPAVAISGPVAAGTTNPVSSQRRPAGDSIAQGQSSGHSTQQQQRRPPASTASAGPSPTPASTIPPSHQGGVDRSSGQSRRHPSASSSTVVPSSTSQQSELEDRSGPQNAPYNTSVQQPHVASKPGRLSRRHVSSFGSINDPEPTNPPFQQPGISGLGRPPNQPHSASSSNVSSPSFAQYGIAAGSGQTPSHSWPQSLSPVSSIHHTVAMPPPRLPSQQPGISDVLGPQHAPFRQDSFQAQLTSMYQDPLNPNSLPQLQPQGSIGGFATQAQAQSQPAVSQMVLPTMSPMPFIMPTMMTPGQHPLQSANAYPVVSPSGQGGFQTPRAPAAHTIPTQPQRTTTQPQSGGIDAHKIGEYADTALKVGTAAFKLFRMAETLTGNDNNN